MKNTGEMPEVDLCDIRYRNGLVVRDVKPSSRRWHPWPWGESDFDITDWQMPVGRR